MNNRYKMILAKAVELPFGDSAVICLNYRVKMVYLTSD